MDMRELMGEPRAWRWMRLVLFGGFAVAAAAWAIGRKDVAMLANGVGLGMFAAAMFCRPAWHFRGAGREVYARLASSPAVLFLYVGSLTLFGFGLLARWLM